MFGCLGVWVFGCLGVWVIESLSVWVFGCCCRECREAVGCCSLAPSPACSACTVCCYKDCSLGMLHIRCISAGRRRYQKEIVDELIKRQVEQLRNDTGKQYAVDEAENIVGTYVMDNVDVVKAVSVAACVTHSVAHLQTSATLLISHDTAVASLILIPRPLLSRRVL